LTGVKAAVTFVVYRGTAPKNWDEIVCGLGGSIYHSTIWAEYQKKRKEGQPIFLLGFDNNGLPCAGALALLKMSPYLIVSRLSCSLVLSTHPFTRDYDRNLSVAFMRKCEDYARSLGCIHMAIDSFLAGGSAYFPCDFGYRETRRLEFCVDLYASKEELWRNISRDQRERIRRLSREGVATEIGMERKDLKDLEVAREFTQAKRSQQGMGYDLPTSGEFYDAIYEYLIKRGVARLFLAKRGREILGAILFAAFNGRASSIFSGSTEFGYKLGVQSGLFWAAVESFKKEGFLELNRGGILESAANETDPLHGIYRFKQRLGTRPVVCRSGERILSPLRYRLLGFGSRILRPYL